jgi:hypothetical protein
MLVTKNAARASRGQASRLQDDARFDEVLPLIQRAKDRGITFEEIRQQILGDAQAASRLTGKLRALVKEGAIRGPVKYATPHRKTKEDYYFAAGLGPSAATASAQVVHIARQRGASPPSAKILKAEVKGIDAVFLTDGIRFALESREVLELTCGTNRFYVHRDVALAHFGQPAPSQRLPVDAGELTLDAILPTYRRLKVEQRGLSAVDILDLINALDVPKEALHALLLKETKAGRVTIHRTTSVTLSREVLEAGIRLPGFTDPFVTVVVRNEP